MAIVTNNAAVRSSSVVVKVKAVSGAAIGWDESHG